MDNIIVILVILAAFLYLINRFRKMLNPKEPGCGCGCGSECTPEDNDSSQSSGN